MKLAKDQLSFVADKLKDSADYVLALLVLGQMVADKVQSILMLLGLVFYFWMWSVSVKLKKGVK